MSNQYMTRKAAIQAALLENSPNGSDADIQDHVLYDTMLYQATTFAAMTSFFSVPINGTYGAGVKTLTETNMTVANQLPGGQKMVVDGISIALLAMVVGADTDANTVQSAFANLLQNSNVRIKLPAREYDWEAPGSRFLPGVYINGLDSAANGRRAGDLVNSGIIPLENPVFLTWVNGQPTTFNVNMATASSVAANVVILNTASNTLNTQVAALQFRLHGTLYRGK